MWFHRDFFLGNIILVPFKTVERCLVMPLYLRRVSNFIALP